MAATASLISPTHRLGLSSNDPLVEYIRGDFDASEYADADPDRALEDVRLESPVGRPGR